MLPCWLKGVFMALKARLSSLGSVAATVARTFSLLWRVARLETLMLAAITMIRGLTPALAAWFTKQVIDGIAAQVDWTSLMSLLTLLIVVIALESFLSPWANLMQTRMNEKVTAQCNLLMMEKANSFPDLTLFEDKARQDQLELLRQYALYRPSMFVNRITWLAQNSIGLVSLLWLLTPLAWWLPFLLLAAFIPQVILAGRLEERVWDVMNWSSFDVRRMKYFSTAPLNVTFAKEIRVFGLGDFFVEQYKAAFGRVLEQRVNVYQREALWTSLAGLLTIASLAFCLVWVVRQGVTGVLSVGSVVLFLQSLTGIQGQLEAGISIYTQMYEDYLYMNSFFKFLDEKATMNIQENAVSPQLEQGITFENVGFQYDPERSVLNDVSFKIGSGEIVALVGENGAGKSTLVKLLLRLYDPTQGKILVDGQDLKGLELSTWRSMISVAFQDFCNYRLTVSENIAVGDVARVSDEFHIQKAATKSGLDSVISTLPEQYQTILGKEFGGTEFSQGQMQKVALARAFMRDDKAKLLILDEPTASLDPKSEHDVYESFTHLAKGKSVLLITHRLASVQMADKIIVLKEGRIVEQGCHQELLAKQGEYAALWRLQAEKYAT
jgi:ATP-binding cassette, subfamily B, bacterial